MTTIDRINWPDHLFREYQASWEAREAAPEGWGRRVEAAARAIERSLDSADPNDWMPRALAAAALTADAALAGQHTTDEETDR